MRYWRGGFLNPGAVWKSGWFVGVIVTLLFLAAHYFAFRPLQRMELMAYDYQLSRSEVAADSRIVLVNVDKQSLSAAKPKIAHLIDKLSAAGASVVALDQLYEQGEAISDAGQAPLLQAIRRSGITLLPLFATVSANHEYANDILPHELNGLSISHVNPTGVDARPIQAGTLRYPYATLIQAAAGVGHMSVFGDDDGVVRSEPLIITYADKYFPSMPLMLAARVLNIPLADIRINLGRDIELGAMNLATDAMVRMYPFFANAAQAGGFRSYTLQQALSERMDAVAFKDKIVLIGSGEQLLQTPAGAMSRIAFTANMLQSILHDHYISRPAWTQALEWGLLLLVGLYLIILLPRLSRQSAVLLSAVLLLILLVAAWIALSGYALWLQTLSAALLLLSGHLLFVAMQLQFGSSKQQRAASDLDETNKMLGLSFQSQGMLDKALEKFIACPFDEEMAGMLYELAQAFERKRQFDQAVAAYAHILERKADFRDVPIRIAHAKNARQAGQGKDANSALSSLLKSGDSTPVLGRYEIISELGKGAMGTVYLGKDPKINRQVAIKTMALSQEFEPDELAEVKAKFFHEAEIAGMLNHPNIVTIFDAGDEHDLAYIAMEFLDGIDLVPYTKKGKLLPVATTLKIVAKVAEALKYAHAHGVIHRDIKPANIMILKNKTVKVTDFGIAHINESSKKKSGTVLGTPSYMSPEQLSGKQLDGRSDLFSLGVMLYELVSGVRPFRGESISKLMFKIAKEPHTDVREHNADVPECVSSLIDHLLTKKADLRIESADVVLARIAACLSELKQQGGGQ